MGRKIFIAAVILIIINSSLFAASNQSMLDEIENIKEDLARIDKEQEALFSQIRFQIRGSAKGAFSRNIFSKPGEVFDFTGKLFPEGTVGDQQTNLNLRIGVGPKVTVYSELNGFLNWATKETNLSADNFLLEIKEPNWQARAGAFWTSFTPLTLFYALDDPPFETPLFNKLRAEDRLQVGIEKNHRKLEGFQLNYFLNDLEVEGVLARVLSTDSHIPASFHRYLWGLRSTLKPNENYKLGLNYVELKDDHLSGSGLPMANKLLGAEAELKLGNIQLNHEFVRSHYDDDLLRGLPASKDYAHLARIEYKMANAKLETHFLKNGPFFYAPSAQSRDYELGTVDAPIFGMPEHLTATSKPVSAAVDEALPYGLATANRKGFQFKVLLGDNLYFEQTNLQEVRPANENGNILAGDVSRRRFSVSKVGGTVPLDALLGQNLLDNRLAGIDLFANYGRRKTTATGSDPLLGQSYELGISYPLQRYWTLYVGNKTEVEAAKTNYFLVGLAIDLSTQTTLQLGYQESTNEKLQVESLYLNLKAEF